MTPKVKSPIKAKVLPPKQKPVSVLDFFGTAAVRQAKKTVATKRKSVSHGRVWHDKSVCNSYLLLYLCDESFLIIYFYICDLFSFRFHLAEGLSRCK